MLIVELRTSPKTKCGVVAHRNTLWVTFGNEVSTLMDCNFKSICRIQEFLGVLKRSGCELSQNNSQMVLCAIFGDQTLTASQVVVFLPARPLSPVVIS